MQKVWKWIKTKRLNLKKDDENKYPNKRKWHSYIFSRGDRQAPKTIAENFDQIASTSLPAISSNRQRNGKELPKKGSKHNETKNDTVSTNSPTKSPRTMTVSLNIELSSKKSHGTSKDIVLVERKTSQTTDETFTTQIQSAIQAMQAIEGPSGISLNSGGDEEILTSGRSSHTYFSATNSPSPIESPFVDSQQGSPVKRASIKSPPRISIVEAPSFTNTLSPATTASGSEARKLWRLSIQSSIDLSSTDEERFDADDEITATCYDNLSAAKNDANPAVPSSASTEKKGFLENKTISELALRPLPSIDNTSSKLDGSLLSQRQKKKGLERADSDYNDYKMSSTTSALSLGQVVLPTSLRTSRKLRFIIPQVSISTVDFNGSTNLSGNETAETNRKNTAHSETKGVNSTATMISAAVMYLRCENKSGENGCTANVSEDRKPSGRSLNLLSTPGSESLLVEGEDSARNSLSDLDRRQISLAQRRQSNLELVHQASGRRTSTTLIPLTSAQIHLVRSLWRQVYLSKGPTVIGQTIQHRLFFKAQTLREQFREAASVLCKRRTLEAAQSTVLKSSMNYDGFSKLHCKQIGELIDKVVESLDDLESVGPELERIGRMHAHVARGQLSSKLWNAVAETFIDCTLEWGDRRARSETVRKAWALIVAFIVERIKHGHLEERRQIAALNSTIHSLERVGTSNLQKSSMGCPISGHQGPRMNFYSGFRSQRGIGSLETVRANNSSKFESRKVGRKQSYSETINKSQQHTIV